LAAAYAAGALNFEEALGVAYFRGVLSEKYQKPSKVQGGMLAVGLGFEGVQPYLKNYDQTRITVACINSSASVTLSGDLDIINELHEKISEDGLFARKLKVKAAYHSSHMLPMADEYLASLGKILSPKRTLNGVLYASPVTGDMVESGETLGPQHWLKNLLQPVLFCFRMPRVSCASLLLA
jgi:acyl transferase domain-containing protein